MSWVRLLASVNFFNYFVASFLLCCPCEASNFDKGRHNSNNYVDSKSAYNL